MSYKYAKEISLHQAPTVLFGGTRKGNWHTEIFPQTNVTNRPTTRSKDRNRNIFLTWYILPNWHMNTLLSLDFFLSYALSSIRHYNFWKSFICYKKNPRLLLFYLHVITIKIGFKMFYYSIVIILSWNSLHPQFFLKIRNIKGHLSIVSIEPVLCSRSYRYMN